MISILSTEGPRYRISNTQLDYIQRCSVYYTLHFINLIAEERNICLRDEYTLNMQDNNKKNISEHIKQTIANSSLRNDTCRGPTRSTFAAFLKDRGI